MVQKRQEKLNWGKVRNPRGLITKPTVQLLARRIARQFRPDKIVLFGSYAYGRPTPESDIDLLVIMPARNEIDQSLRIEEWLDPPFSLDVMVRTPRNLGWRLEEGDWLLREAVGKGKVLYEKAGRGKKYSPRTAATK
ncbi:MAG TPA: nucleotidyltransferase domain-containing protein [Gemmataceae bacterium]|nr:nucleotidyltransferase domain-containing protein [Gemmataceae bacterium]